MDWDKLEQDAFSMLNLTPHELYEYTHSEYTNMMKGYMARYDQQLRLGQWTAHHIAQYVGIAFGGGKLPDLKDILTKPLFSTEQVAPPKQLTAEQTYEQSRNYILSLRRAGISVKQALLDKYNIMN